MGQGYNKTPEERVGALVWRMHRSARVIFTMNFHLGKWTPQQCVQSLIDNVGFEPDNAAGEVRRSFDGSVGPLYQIAYLMGALQFRALHKELVDSKKMTDREFADAVLHENSMPIEMLRADLERQKLTSDFKTSVEVLRRASDASLARMAAGLQLSLGGVLRTCVVADEDGQVVVWDGTSFGGWRRCGRRLARR